MNNKKIKIFDMFCYIIGSLSYGFTSLIYMIIINRMLGVEATGQYSFAFAVASIFYTIGVYFGMTYQVTDSSDTFSDTDYIYNRLFTCAVMILLALIFSFIKSYNFSKLLLVMLLVCYRGFDALFDSLHAIIQKKDRIYKIGILILIRTFLLIVSFSIVTFIFKRLIISVISIALIDFLFTLIVELPFTKKYITSSKFNIKKIERLLVSGFFVFAFSFLAMYILNSPKYVIDLRLNNELQGIFGIIFMPSSFMSMVSIYMIHPFLNEITLDIKNNKYRDLTRLIIKISFIIFIFGLFVSLIAFLIGIPFLEFIYGIKLLDYKLDLLIIMIGTIWYSLYSLLSSVMIAMRKNVHQVIILMFISVFSYFICNLLIGKYGISGAAYSYFVIMIVQLFIYICLYITFILNYRNNDKI